MRPAIPREVSMVTCSREDGGRARAADGGQAACPLAAHAHCPSEHLEQQRPLRVQPVLGLIDHHGIGAVQDGVVDLDVAAHRQAVHDDAAAAPGRAQAARRELPVAQRGALFGLLLGLAVQLDRAPRLHVDRVGADRGVVGVVDDVDELAAGLLGGAADQRGVVGVELVARRPGDHDLHAEAGGGERGAGGHGGRQGLRVPGPAEHEALARRSRPASRAASWRRPAPGRGGGGRTRD